MVESEPDPEPDFNPDAIPQLVDTPETDWDWEEPAPRRSRWPLVALIALAVLGGAGYWGWGRYYGPGSKADPHLVTGASASPAASAAPGAAPAVSAAPSLSGSYVARIGDQDVAFQFDQQQPLGQAKGYGSYVNRVTNRKCATQIVPATIQPSDLPAGAVAFDQSPREGYTACAARIPLSIEPGAAGAVSVKWYKPGTSEVLMSGILEPRKDP